MGAWDFLQGFGEGVLTAAGCRFADFWNDLGQACIMLIVVVCLLGCLIGSLARTAGKAPKNEETREGIKLGV